MSLLKGRSAWIFIVILALGLMIMSRFARPFVYTSGDVDIYQSIGEAVWKGSGLLKSEYPPVTSALFAVLSSPSLGIPFPDAWTAFIVLACLAATGWVAWKCSAKEAVFLLLSIVATMLLLGLDVTWGRYDLLVGILLVLTWLAHKHGKFAAAGFFLMLSAGLKLVPIVLVPFLFMAIPRVSRRTMLKGLMVGMLIAVLLPLLILGPVALIENSLYMVMYHAERGVQLESTWSGLTILWEVLHGRHATMLFTFRSHENIEVPSILPLFGLVLGLFGIFGILLRTKKSRETGLVFLCSLSWLLFLSPVLSPQYICWILPLVITWSAIQWTEGEASRSSVLILCTAISIALLTNWFYLPLYLNLVEKQDLLPALVLNLRNTLLLVFAILCYRASTSRSRSTSAA